MSSHYFDHIDSGGNAAASNGAMNVYLYAYSTNERTFIDDSGEIADTLTTCAADLLDDNEINYFSINRFESENNSYPEDDWTGGLDDDGSFEQSFLDFLENGTTNGSGANLHSLQGAHLLVHPGSGCNEYSGGVYAPPGAETEGGDAFNEGVAAWSPICDYAMLLSRNAAIQEVLHTFIEGSSFTDEHAYGTINSAGYNRYSVSPMLTYHWDDNVGGICGNRSASAPDTYHQYITDCTSSAVGSSWWSP